MTLWNNFWGIVEIFFLVFITVAYLMALFSVVLDLFRDRALNGWLKAVWLLFLVFVPVLTTLVYLIARGGGMAERTAVVESRGRQAIDSSIRAVAGAGPADQIAQAKTLLDAGTITAAEFEVLKAKALQAQP
ncbi:SHOCT domain-containing protein [Leifsonia poae]|uniref:SHOCT domain-containing protein n=1 Tax=Leifsonia poae TaxID=110933 RepID=UPI001CC017A5|nr:SHOCT domain-containing protein [Leifsonia poae]